VDAHCEIVDSSVISEQKQNQNIKRNIRKQKKIGAVSKTKFHFCLSPWTMHFFNMKSNLYLCVCA